MTDAKPHLDFKRLAGTGILTLRVNTGQERLTVYPPRLFAANGRHKLLILKQWRRMGDSNPR